MKIKGQWLERLGMFSLFLTIISLMITITINFEPLYSWSVTHLGILDYTDLTKEQLLDNYRQLMSFLNNPWNQNLSVSDFPMSISGIGHFYDVKKLFILNYSVLLVTIIPTIFFLRYCKKYRRFWRMIRPMQWAMGIPVLFGALMLIGFDTFFVKFHQIFFSNDDWLFNPVTDPIINVLPEQFFMYCFILFFVLIEVAFLIFMLLGKRELKSSSN